MNASWLLAGLIMAGAAVACGGTDAPQTTGDRPDAAESPSDGKSNERGVPMDAKEADAMVAAGKWPALDCTVDDREYCIAVALIINGVEAEFTCLPSNRDIVSVNESRWAISCHDSTGRLNFRASAPVRGEGTFVFSATEVQTPESTLEILKLSDETNKAQLNSRAPNLFQAQVKETVTANGVHVGTFEGDWTIAEPECRSFVYACASGTLRGTFRFQWEP